MCLVIRGPIAVVAGSSRLFKRNAEDSNANKVRHGLVDEAENTPNPDNLCRMSLCFYLIQKNLRFVCKVSINVV